MAAFENYRKIGTVGMAYKKDYDPSQEYKYANTVYYEGSTYIALKDNPEGEPKNDGVNWRYFAKGLEGSTVESINGKTGVIKLTADDVGAISDDEKGKPDGVASLDKDGKVPKEQLPDDIGVDLSVVSDKFFPDKEYAAGDYCIHNDVLYKFTDAKAVGDWDDSVVESTNVGSEISSLSNNLTDAISGIPFVFGIDSEGNYGYIKAGADTVTPFNGDFSVGSLSYGEGFGAANNSTNQTTSTITTSTANANVTLSASHKFLIIAIAEAGVCSGYQNDTHPTVNWDLKEPTVTCPNANLDKIKSKKLYNSKGILFYAIYYVTVGNSDNILSASATAQGYYLPAAQICIIAIRYA